MRVFVSVYAVCVCSSQGYLLLWYTEEKGGGTENLHARLFLCQHGRDVPSKENGTAWGEWAKTLDPVEQKGPQRH